jgi:hypothetical protein
MTKIKCYICGKPTKFAYRPDILLDKNKEMNREIKKVLSNKEAKEMKERVKKFRKEFKKDLERRYKTMTKQREIKFRVLRQNRQKDEVL